MKRIAVGNSPHMIRALGFYAIYGMPRRKMTTGTGMGGYRMGGYRQATEPYRAASVRPISTDGLWPAEYGNHIPVA